jgi:lipoic acid synthetase
MSIRNISDNLEVTVCGNNTITDSRNSVQIANKKMRGAEKIIPVSSSLSLGQQLRKPAWIRAQSPYTPAVISLRKLLRNNKLHTVCEEANCPNLGECFSNGTATFMIMGDICTRRCPFCDVSHGRPNPLDPSEPGNLACAVFSMGLKYVVITSVDRDDLRDGGAEHFVDCIRAVRARNAEIIIEILTPDFRGRIDKAIGIMRHEPPDVFNHNLETIPRLYRRVRPGADYQHSLSLLKRFKACNSDILTKSGLILGLGEMLSEIEDVMHDMRTCNVDILTLGQYLQPSAHHMPVYRYVTPEEFEHLKLIGEKLGFIYVASSPMVRSSYHADTLIQKVRSCRKRASLLDHSS